MLLLECKHHCMTIYLKESTENNLSQYLNSSSAVFGVDKAIRSHENPDVQTERTKLWPQSREGAVRNRIPFDLDIISIPVVTCYRVYYKIRGFPVLFPPLVDIFSPDTCHQSVGSMGCYCVKTSVISLLSCTHYHRSEFSNHRAWEWPTSWHLHRFYYYIDAMVTKHNVFQHVL